MWDIVAIWIFHTICTAEQEIFKHCQAKNTYKNLLLLGFPRDFNGRSLFFLNSQLYLPSLQLMFILPGKGDDTLRRVELALRFGSRISGKISGDLQLRWLPLFEQIFGRTAVCCDLWDGDFFRFLLLIHLPDNFLPFLEQICLFRMWMGNIL